MNANIPIYILSLCFVVLSCKSEGGKFEFNPLGEVIHPSTNLYSSEKAELGKNLFFDKRLSFNNEISCATCHIPENEFTDSKALAIGVEGRIAFRNTPSLWNVGFSKTFMYDGEIKTLEEQVLVPILDHNEMGGTMKEVVNKLKSDPKYQQASNKIFNRDIDAYVITRSIACYERTLIKSNSKFDQFYFDNKKSLNASQKRGWILFKDKLNCVKCHPAPFFTDFKMHNNGRTHIVTEDKGRFRVTSDSSDIGFFKTPSLRNTAITAPYMHDGSLVKLNDVVDYYMKGGDDGLNKELEIKPFRLNLTQKNDLINFIKSLNNSN